MSILTPSYGYARFLPDAIESIRAQGHGDVEHIIMDGASTDGTVELLAREHGLIWRSEPDAGQSDALNKALDLASGEIVGWLNADEFYLPGAFERVLAVFEKTDVDVVFGDAAFVDVDGRLLRLLAHHRFHRFVLRNYGTFITSCSVFIRRSALDTHPWDRESRRIMDWDLYLKLERQGARFAYTPQAVGAFRVHDERVTARPMAHDHPERISIRTRHGLPTVHGRVRRSRALGRATRIALKTIAGSYRREHRAKRLRGADLRWWLDESAHAEAAADLTGI